MTNYSPNHASAICDDFSSLYPILVWELNKSGEIVESRNGTTREFLNFKTTILEPQKRFVAGYKRGQNPFFLIAEAIWIFTGRDDVKSLKIFNNKIADYSDDGYSFHGAYGCRLRSYGDKRLDQIAEIVKMIEKNSSDRRIVASIWDSNLDLNKDSKDIPCNDMLMFKVRNGKLHTTIQNRSNDLHWGLTTNLFQFSFLSEIIAKICDLQIGSQIHNSQSLHVYTDLPLNESMVNQISLQSKENDFYSTYKSLNFESFNFQSKSWTTHQKLEILTDFFSFNFNKIVCGKLKEDDLKTIFDFSNLAGLVYFSLIDFYCKFKRKEISKDSLTYEFLFLLRKINEISNIGSFDLMKYDALKLAENFLLNLINNTNEL